MARCGSWLLGGWFVGDRCVERVTEIAGQPLGRVFDVAGNAGARRYQPRWSAPEHRKQRDAVALEIRPSGVRPAVDAFCYTGTEAVIGRCDPHSQQLDFIHADAACEGTEAVNYGTSTEEV